eukprot:TRINITY_DN2941_c0_g2_i1.p1 TRINITY_DN2941_c0_g2~~TRINITY_DN2941_c0_g2_i1.p1  ORF type:complete len:238 (+),score=60.46 TRINITY_DN2941_c0_g2_i1:806-1519(+)
MEAFSRSAHGGRALPSSNNVDLATLRASRSLNMRNDPQSMATPSGRRGGRTLDPPTTAADGQCGGGVGGGPARARGLLASMVGAELARDTDVYEGIPATRNAQVHRAPSHRVASRVAAGADPRMAVEEEVADVDIYRRRSIDVSSLASGRAAAAAAAAASPSSRSSRWRSAGFKTSEGVKAFGRVKGRLREAVGGPPSPTAVLLPAADQRGGVVRSPPPIAGGDVGRGGNERWRRRA